VIVQSPIIIFHPTVGSGHVLAGPRDSSNQSAGKKPFQIKDQAALHFPISYLLVTDRAYHINPAWDGPPPLSHITSGEEKSTWVCEIR